MKKGVRKRLWTVVFPAILAALVFAVPLSGFSADTNNEIITNDVDNHNNNQVENHNDNPAFTSITDVARAEQHASKTAAQPVSEVIAAMQAEHQAEIALQSAIQSGDSQAIAAAQAARL